MNKQKIMILSLAVALIFILNYLVLDNFFEQNEKQLRNAYLSGRDEGINETISVLFKEAENCNVIPIFIENSSKNLIDVSCLELP